MGLRIELEVIWKRLQTRFKARRKTDTDPEDPDHPVLIETIQPVTDADELLKDYQVADVGDITRTHAAGSGYETAFECPQGKRYHIMGCRIHRTVGDMTAGDLHIEDAGIRIRLISLATGADAEFNQFPQTVILDEGMELVTYLTAVAADSTFNVHLYCAVEDAF